LWLTRKRRTAEAAPRAQHEAGLHFCKGLYHRYSNQPREALEELNQARVDGEWGEEAVINMVRCKAHAHGAAG
jgi:hypothetical protein